LQIFRKYGSKCTQILIFSVLKMVFFHTDCKQNFQCHCFFTYLHLRSICGTRNSSQPTLLQCLSTINVIFSDQYNILIKGLYLKGYTAKRLTDESPENSWAKHGVNKLLKKLRNTGTVDRATKRSHNNRLFSDPPIFYQKNN